jgi:hypothetical protein
MAPVIVPPATRTRRLTIVAQDPGVRHRNGTVVTALVDVPAEELAPGPRGYRVHVVDYDATSRTLYEPFRLPPDADPYKNVGRPADILDDPRFHAQNVYAIVMRTLSRFEFGLGRRVAWGFDGHQLTVAPHAFADANAFYSEADQSLLFGYFPARQGGNVFTCLSHDIVAHEATHAILDGIRERFTEPSSPDQAAFHEALSDIVALLSVFSLPGLVEAVLTRSQEGRVGSGRAMVPASRVTYEALRDSVLLGLADEMGEELAAVRGEALRRSVSLDESAAWKDDPDFEEPHRRGEVLVAAVMRAFLRVWVMRIGQLGPVDRSWYDLGRVAEEGADVAGYLLTMTIRALDYTPPVHIEFGDYLSAMLTADVEIRPDDTRYGFRRLLLESFAKYGLAAASSGGSEPGVWRPCEVAVSPARNRFESLTRDRDEMFRFAWENRRALGLMEGAYTRVISVRPCLRIGPDDGFPLRETVAEVFQQLILPASGLRRLGIEKPEGLDGSALVELQGGVTLVLDEYGQLKFAVHKRLHDRDDPSLQARQSARLGYLQERGFLSAGRSLRGRLSSLHRARALDSSRRPGEVW